jgi:UDPglucose 6-dehydrogenase
MTSIAVVGSGYVGTVVATAFAYLGNEVLAVEANHARLEALRAGRPPFYEDGLAELLERQLKAGTIEFTDELGGAVARSEVVFLCLGTPEGMRGRPDLSSVHAVAGTIGDAIGGDVTIVTKSTVPIGTNHQIRTIVEDAVAAREAGPYRVSVVANPEFLRAGKALGDFFHPDRIVLGASDEAGLQAATALYEPIVEQRLPGADPAPRDDVRPVVLVTDCSTAETIKYAANSFLAMKISFINEVAQICDRVGADVTDVARGLGLDHRISPLFLNAGLGWGGSCFGKDLAALSATARDHGYEPDLLAAIRDVNDKQRSEVTRRLQQHLGTLRGRKIAILGLAFKPGTDDTRDAPAVDIAIQLDDQGASVSAYDPVVTALPDAPHVRIASDPYEAVDRADAVVLATEWPQIVALDMERMASAMAGKVVIDGRNALDPATVTAAGLTYEGIGRRA